jgi:hypothetical protein
VSRSPIFYKVVMRVVGKAREPPTSKATEYGLASVFLRPSTPKPGVVGNTSSAPDHQGHFNCKEGNRPFSAHEVVRLSSLDTPFIPFFIFFLLNRTQPVCPLDPLLDLGIFDHSIDSWVPHAGTIFREAATIRGQSTEDGVWRGQISEIYSLCLLCRPHHCIVAAFALLTKN